MHDKALSCALLLLIRQQHLGVFSCQSCDSKLLSRYYVTGIFTRLCCYVKFSLVSQMSVCTYVDHELYLLSRVNFSFQQTRFQGSPNRTLSVGGQFNEEKLY